MRRDLCYSGLTLLIAGAGGCSLLLPVTKTVSPTFQSFEEARQTIESLVPGQSDRTTLTALGMNPVKQPNIVILTHADVLRRVISGNILEKKDLDPGIVHCIDARDNCRGWELNVSQITKARNGFFLSDFMNFRRRTETTGWRFNALILLVNDVVVYRTWGGQPIVSELEVHTNPLGPLQDVGPSMVPNPIR